MRLLLVEVRKDELAALFWSFAYFFCLLCSYYILRPLRDEMGIQGGVQNLPWVFTGTFVAMLCAVPAFGWLAARRPRRVMLPAVYYFFIANLLVFFALFSGGVATEAVARAFFIWVSVFNLFAVSVFWSFMVDLFSEQQAKRLFGFIAAGGSAGALAGPALTAGLANSLGPINLLPVSALFLALATLCIHRLLHWASANPHALQAAPLRKEEPIGGGVWAGVTAVARSPYLLGICLYMLLYTTLSTFLYFEQARIVADSYATPEHRTTLFAGMDLAVNLLSLAGQAFVTGNVIVRLGLPVALAVVPSISLAGFAVLGLLPVLAVVVGLQVLRRAGDFAIARPARELLFTMVNRAEKYKAKNFIDTVVYRGGDAASGWLFTALRGLGLSLSAISYAALPIAFLWLATGVMLGRKEQALAREAEAE